MDRRGIDLGDASDGWEVPTLGQVVATTDDGWRVVYRIAPRGADQVVVSVSIRPTSQAAGQSLDAARVHALFQPDEAASAHRRALIRWLAEAPDRGRAVRVLIEAADHREPGLGAAWLATIAEDLPS